MFLNIENRQHDDDPFPQIIHLQKELMLHFSKENKVLISSFKDHLKAMDMVYQKAHHETFKLLDDTLDGFVAVVDEAFDDHLEKLTKTIEDSF